MVELDRPQMTISYSECTLLANWGCSYTLIIYNTSRTTVVMWTCLIVWIFTYSACLVY